MFSETLFKFSLRRDPDWIDVLVRELHVRIASKLRENPDLLEIPLHNLRIWKRNADHETKLLLRRWKLILISWQFEDILDFIISDTPESRSLRRYSPFCGILNPQEIASVWEDTDRAKVDTIDQLAD